MKFIVFLLVFKMFLPSPILDEVRLKFPDIDNIKQTDYYLEQLENIDGVEAQAYFAAMLFMKSKYVKFPITKYKYFKKGKLKLDKLIQTNPKNIEIRYIRYLFQNEIPKFLGYHNNIEEDYLIIINGIETSNYSNDFKCKVLNYMLLVENITIEKSKRINYLLKNIKCLY